MKLFFLALLDDVLPIIIRDVARALRAWIDRKLRGDVLALGEGPG